MTLRYTTVKQFWKQYGMNNSIMEFLPGEEPSREVVKASPVIAGSYYLNHMGVNQDTLKLYASSTQLTLTTHYTFDSESSKVTITAAGVTAISTNDLTAEYEYCSLGKDLDYNETTTILQSAEKELETNTYQRFSNTTTPQYRQINNEEQMFIRDKLRMKYGINTNYNPIVLIETTVNGEYTTGGSTITLTDASKLPNSGTLNIGGYKVIYVSKSSNVLTIPTSTPSIADGSAVTNAVVEVSVESEGNAPSWQVLEDKEEYETYHNYGYIKILNPAYFNQVSYANLDIYPDNIKVRVSYMQAWHNPNEDPEIPQDVVECVYQIAARNLRRNTVFKSHIGQRDNFTPTTSTESKEYIENVYNTYRVQNIEIR